MRLEQLLKILPSCSAIRAANCLPHLEAAVLEFEINTPLRLAAFLAQLAHESGEFRYFEELASGEAYEGRVNLGNIHPGDGVRYKGRGPIQITGRTNYRRAGAALGLDLEQNPEKAAELDTGFRVAGWYWQSNGLNQLADHQNIRAISIRINGGFRGMEERKAYYARACKVLCPTEKNQ